MVLPQHPVHELCAFQESNHLLLPPNPYYGLRLVLPGQYHWPGAMARRRSGLEHVLQARLLQDVDAYSGDSFHVLNSGLFLETCFIVKPGG